MSLEPASPVERPEVSADGPKGRRHHRWGVFEGGGKVSFPPDDYRYCPVATRSMARPPAEPLPSRLTIVRT